MNGDTCRYSFSPADWVAEHGRPTSVDSEWCCPRDPIEGADRCPFHLTSDERTRFGIGDAELSRQFLAEVGRTGKSSSQLIGARFGDLYLSDEVIQQDTNAPIDLRHATIEGSIHAEQVAINQPLLLDDVTVEGNANLSNAELSQYVRVRNGLFREELDCENATFDSDAVFTDCEFDGRTTFDRASFAGSAEFHNVTFGSETNFEESRSLAGCIFHQSTFEDDANFLSANLQGRSDFRGTSFRDTVRFSRCSFGGEALFINATFDAEALFKKALYEGPAHYQNTVFRGEASFSETDFVDKVKFRYAEFHGEASISYARFGNNAYFPQVRFHDYAEFFECSFDRLADFRGTTFSDIARFMKATFEEEAYFDRARFETNADFRKACANASCRFEGSTFVESPTMQGAVFAEARFVDVTTPKEALTVHLEGSEIEGGKIVQSNDDAIYFDLKDGLIGNVDIDFAETRGTFDRFRFYRTEFDGFDFSNHHYTLTPDWVIHRFTGPREEYLDLEAGRFDLSESDPPRARDRSSVGGDTRSTTGIKTRVAGLFSPRAVIDRFVTPSAPDLEATYLKAKNGASKVGDSRAASKFFIHEMRYRRASYLNKTFSGAEPPVLRMRYLSLALMNVLLSISCGYGEKPRRTLQLSGAIILLYQLLFISVLEVEPFGSELGYLLLSIQSFVSLVFGETSAVPGFTASFLAATEGFVGAFMIGLFIFSLTRSIHR